MASESLVRRMVHSCRAEAGNEGVLKLHKTTSRGLCFHCGRIRPLETIVLPIDGDFFSSLKPANEPSDRPTLCDTFD